MRSMAGRLEPRLAVALLVPFIGVVVPSQSLDFLPLYTAATLVARGDTHNVYLPADAPSLLYPTPTFLQLALEHGSSLGVGLGQVTAFVASPPSLLLALPFTALPFAHAARLWAVLQAACVSASLWLL